MKSNSPKNQRFFQAQGLLPSTTLEEMFQFALVSFLQHGVTLQVKNEIDAKVVNKLNYLQVPLNVLYNFPVRNTKSICRCWWLF